MSLKKKENRPLWSCIGKTIHDWGTGVGAICVGIAAIWALWGKDSILENILKIQNQAKEIKDGVSELKKGNQKIDTAINQLGDLIKSNISQSVTQKADLTPEFSEESLRTLIPTDKQSVMLGGVYLPEQKFKEVYATLTNRNLNHAQKMTFLNDSLEIKK